MSLQGEEAIIHEVLYNEDQSVSEVRLAKMSSFVKLPTISRLK
jgi:hypothetical protein